MFFESLRSGLDALLDIVTPLKARSARTRSRSLEDIPLRPVSHELLGQRIATILEYRASEVQDLIRSLKYDGSSHAASLAASLLADYLREEIADSKALSARRVLITPIPLHPSRKRQRGFNQIELVLRALPREFRDGTLASFAPQVLERGRATQQQTRLSRAERLKNVANAFSVPRGISLGDTHIFLIDDVTTTGATLASAGKPLRAAGARVSLIALSRA